MKKAVSRMAAIFLCLTMFLTGCSSNDGRDERHEKNGANDVHDDTNNADDANNLDDANDAGSAGEVGGLENALTPFGTPGDKFPTAADYYRYLRDDVLTGSEAGYYTVSAELASTEPLELKIDQGDFMETFAWDHRMTGTISAVVEDFDNDGALEMITVIANSISVQDSRFGSILYPDTEYNPDERIFELYTSLYDVEDGEIVKTDHHSVPIYLPMNGWGYVVVGMEKLDKDYYIYAWTYSENMSTYGPCYYTIEKVCGGEFYQSAIAAYGQSEVAANRQEGLSNYSDTTIYDTMQTIAKTANAESNLEPNEAAFEAALNGGLICFFDIAYPEWGGGKAIQTITDYTNLRHYLSNEAEDWTPFAVPQGGVREIPEGTSGLDSFISEIEAAVGTEFTSSVASEENGIHKETFKTEDNELTVNWDIAQDAPQMVGLYSQDMEPTEEWFTLKDAILSSSVFGWTNGETDALKGKVNWNEFTGGVVVGDYTCGIGLVVCASLQITRN